MSNFSEDRMHERNQSAERTGGAGWQRRKLALEGPEQHDSSGIHVFPPHTIGCDQKAENPQINEAVNGTCLILFSVHAELRSPVESWFE